ncbi:MAG: hypothetical protein NT157_02940 [Candidatus Micrarchaeota archaeon]|nr:hypothetical protein [Candidatus Micrarchaeota archaeon]
MEILGKSLGEYLEIAYAPLALVFVVQFIEFIFWNEYYSLGLMVAGFVLGLWVPAYLGWHVVKRRGGRILHGVVAAAVFNLVGSLICTVFSLTRGVEFTFWGMATFFTIFAISTVFWIVAGAVAAGIAGIIARKSGGGAGWAEGLIVASAAFIILASFAGCALARDYVIKMTMPFEYVLNSTLENCDQGTSFTNDAGWVRFTMNVEGRTTYRGREACHSTVETSIGMNSTITDYYVINKNTRCSVQREDGEEECENWD